MTERKRQRTICVECRKPISMKQGILTLGEDRNYHYDPCFKESRIGLEWRKAKLLGDIGRLESELRTINQKLSTPLQFDRGIRFNNNYV